MRKIKSPITKVQFAILKLIETHSACSSKELAALSGNYTEAMIKGHCHQLYALNLIGPSLETPNARNTSGRHLYVITESGRNMLEGVDLRVNLNPRHIINSVFSLGDKCLLS